MVASTATSRSCGTPSATSVELYNAQWIVEKNGYLSPAQARQAWHAAISIRPRRVRQTCVQGTGCATRQRDERVIPLDRIPLKNMRTEATSGFARFPARRNPVAQRLGHASIDRRILLGLDGARTVRGHRTGRTDAA